MKEATHYLWDNCPDKQFNHAAQRPFEMIDSELCVKMMTDFSNQQQKTLQDQLDKVIEENEKLTGIEYSEKRAWGHYDDLEKEVQQSKEENNRLREGIDKISRFLDHSVDCNTIKNLGTTKGIECTCDMLNELRQLLNR